MKTRPLHSLLSPAGPSWTVWPYGPPQQGFVCTAGLVHVVSASPKSSEKIFLLRGLSSAALDPYSNLFP